VSETTGHPQYGITPSHLQEHGKRVGFDLFVVTGDVGQAQPPMLWLTYLGWSRTREGIETMARHHAAREGAGEEGGGA
jgi:hypothetical protein